MSTNRLTIKTCILTNEIVSANENHIIDKQLNRTSVNKRLLNG